VNPSDELAMRFLLAAFPNAGVKMVQNSWRIHVPPHRLCPDGAFFYFEVKEEFHADSQ
jgi:hypothetical protein